ncbi:hypothetical protein AAC387_Pa01g3515 [Persea americana]
MAHSNSNAVGVDNTFRRKFNREEYLERARELEDQIDDFVRSYNDELKANQSGITDKDIQLSRDQNFALWLKDKALNDVLIPSNVQVLAMGPDRDQVCRNGAPEGNKAPGTYKGGSTSQLQHVAAREASSQGQPIHWLDVYVATRDGLPEAVQIVETYNTLMDKRYPEGTSQPPIDQELWERASSLDPDELADAVATTAQQETDDEARLDDNA